MSTIQLTNVTKEFGRVRALDNVTLTFEENKIYGLLGRNGAGKSTLLNIISNRLFATEGTVTVDGDATRENDRALSKIFCMSDRNLYPDTMRVKDVFKLTATYYPAFDMAYAEGLAQKYQMNTGKKLRNLSTGYSSIYKIVVALACGAPIIFFDEPVLGLDAHHRDMFYKELLDRYIEKPATYIISTHLIEEASDIIEKVVIIKEGKLILDEETESVLAKGYAVSGSSAAVEEYCRGRQLLGMDSLGGLKTAYVLGKCDPSQIPPQLEASKLDLQKLFIQLTNA